MFTSDQNIPRKGFRLTRDGRFLFFSLALCRKILLSKSPISKFVPTKVDAMIGTLTRYETRTLAAIASRIFPSTDTPGAVEAGAVNYILIALGGSYASRLPLYRSGLRAVNRRARERYGDRFAALTEAQQESLLAEFETGSGLGWKKAREFFDTVRCHVLEGVFCEPQYGGNKDMVGWRLVGFPGQQFGYPEAYINQVVTLEPVAAEAKAEEVD